MRRIDAVSFDFYGTLIHHREGPGRGQTLMRYLAAHGLRSAPWRHEVLYELFERHDTDYPRGSSARALAEYRRRLARRAFELLDVEVPTSEADAHADAMWAILGPDAFSVFPDVSGVLARLRSLGYGLALVSNWQRGLGHFVAELGLGEAFDHVVASAEIGFAKPDRRIFETACRLLERFPDRILHVGDTLVDDYEGARSAGLETLLLDRAGEVGTEEARSISNLDQLLDYLGERDSGERDSDDRRNPK